MGLGRSFERLIIGNWGFVCFLVFIGFFVILRLEGGGFGVFCFRVGGRVVVEREGRNLILYY